MNKKIWILAFLIALFTGAPAFADTLNLLTLPSNTYAGYYVGGVGGNVNGGSAVSAMFYCDDFSTNTAVPNSFSVNISTLPSLTYAKWGHDSAALFKYEESAWLISQIASHPTEVGAIQFAIWNIFNPSAPDPAGTSGWVALAGAINPAAYDFSSVRIYTAIPEGSQQEFISGGATPVPEPTTVLLLGSGLVGLWGMRRKFRK